GHAADRGEREEPVDGREHAARSRVDRGVAGAGRTGGGSLRAGLRSLFAREPCTCRRRVSRGRPLLLHHVLTLLDKSLWPLTACASCPPGAQSQIWSIRTTMTATVAAAAASTAGPQRVSSAYAQAPASGTTSSAVMR